MQKQAKVVPIFRSTVQRCKKRCQQHTEDFQVSKLNTSTLSSQILDGGQLPLNTNDGLTEAHLR